MRPRALACLLALVGCQEGAFGAFSSIERACPTSRTREESSCCPAWMLADEELCVLRTWTVATAYDAVGDPGARDPELVLDASGHALLAWEVAASSSSEVWIAEETTLGHLRTRRPARALTGDAVAPSVAISDDAAIVVWKQQQASEGRIFAAERPATGGWRDPSESDVLSPAGNAYEPRAAYGPGEELVLVWNQWTGANFRVLVSRRVGATLDEPVFVSPQVNHANAPQIAIADNGDALVTWYQAPGPDLMVFVSERVREDGDFSRPDADAFISAAGAPVASHPEANPVVAIDDIGGAAIAWTQEDGTGGTPVFLAVRDSLGPIAGPSDLGDAFAAPGTLARGPRVGIAPGGELYVVWAEDLGNHHRVVAALRDARGEWIEDGRDPALLSTAGADAIEPALAIGPDGEALVAYAEVVDGVRRIVARRRHVDASGWIDAEVLSDPSAGEASEPAVAIGSEGRAFAAWVQGPALLGRIHYAWMD